MPWPEWLILLVGIWPKYGDESKANRPPNYVKIPKPTTLDLPSALGDQAASKKKMGREPLIVLPDVGVACTCLCYLFTEASLSIMVLEKRVVSPI